MNDVALSMVVPTLGRNEDLNLLFDSILKCDIDLKYEIIVVDQNEGNLIEDVISKYKQTLPIRHEKVNFRGSSRARNYGTKLAKGEYICYPDDDCTFEKDTIMKAMSLLRDGTWDCVCGRSYDKVTGNDSMFIFPRENKVLTCQNLDNSFVEFAMFFKRELPLNYPYDENLGPGTIHGVHEGYDATFRMLKDGKRIYYTPEIVFCHPEKKKAGQMELMMLEGLSIIAVD